jgi:hypothetical protein
MATFYWIGGYTGGTGPESGYSAADGVWQSLETGLTSDIGDVWFSPYAWKYTQNWLLKSNGSFYPATRTPMGYDTVYFGDEIAATGDGEGYQINPYKYSLLFGGMLGDGWTASGSTAWHGATTSNGKFGPINFVVNADWTREEARTTYTAKTFANYVPTVAGIVASRCEIGRGLSSNVYSGLAINTIPEEYVSFEQGYGGLPAISLNFNPLRIITENFTVNSKVTSLKMRSPLIAIRGLTSQKTVGVSDYTPRFVLGNNLEAGSIYENNNYAGYRLGFTGHTNVLAAIQGYWKTVVHRTGSLWMDSCTPIAGTSDSARYSSYEISGMIRNHSNASTCILPTYYNIYPYRFSKDGTFRYGVGTTYGSLVQESPVQTSIDIQGYRNLTNTSLGGLTTNSMQIYAWWKPAYFYVPDSTGITSNYRPGGAFLKNAVKIGTRGNQTPTGLTTTSFGEVKIYRNNYQFSDRGDHSDADRGEKVEAWVQLGNCRIGTLRRIDSYIQPIYSTTRIFGLNNMLGSDNLQIDKLPMRGMAPEEFIFKSNPSWKNIRFGYTGASGTQEGGIYFETSYAGKLDIQLPRGAILQTGTSPGLTFDMD